MNTELDAIVNSLRGEARTDRTAKNHLQVAESVQREIDEILTAAAAAAGGIEARLAHCHALASETHTIVDRLVGHGPADPSEVQYSEIMLMLDDPHDVPYELSRLRAIAAAIAAVTQTE